MFDEYTERAIARLEEKRAKGERLTKEDRLLLLMSDGCWHFGSELSERVSWRFGGYLFNLKEAGIRWEKERVRGIKDAVVYQYRLVPKEV